MPNVTLKEEDNRIMVQLKHLPYNRLAKLDGYIVLSVHDGCNYGYCAVRLDDGYLYTSIYATKMVELLPENTELIVVPKK